MTAGHPVSKGLGLECPKLVLKQSLPASEKRIHLICTQTGVMCAHLLGVPAEHLGTCFPHRTCPCVICKICMGNAPKLKQEKLEEELEVSEARRH